MFCPGCGKNINDSSKFCKFCGMRIEDATGGQPQDGQPYGGPTSHQYRPAPQGPCHGEGKDWLTTLLLCILLGTFGVHRFYTGHILIGIIQLCTAGCCGIFYIYDIVIIITNSYRDSDGRPLVRYC